MHDSPPAVLFSNLSGCRVVDEISYPFTAGRAIIIAYSNDRVIGAIDVFSSREYVPAYEVSRDVYLLVGYHAFKPYIATRRTSYIPRLRDVDLLYIRRSDGASALLTSSDIAQNKPPIFGYSDIYVVKVAYDNVDAVANALAASNMLQHLINFDLLTAEQRRTLMLYVLNTMLAPATVYIDQNRLIIEYVMVKAIPILVAGALIAGGAVAGAIATTLLLNPIATAVRESKHEVIDVIRQTSDNIIRANTENTITLVRSLRDEVLRTDRETVIETIHKNAMDAIKRNSEITILARSLLATPSITLDVKTIGLLLGGAAAGYFLAKALSR